jgi:hypothetical protein
MDSRKFESYKAALASADAKLTPKEAASVEARGSEASLLRTQNCCDELDRIASQMDAAARKRGGDAEISAFSKRIKDLERSLKDGRSEERRDLEGRIFAKPAEEGK